MRSFRFWLAFCLACAPVVLTAPALAQGFSSQAESGSVEFSRKILELGKQRAALYQAREKAAARRTARGPASRAGGLERRN